MEFEIVPPEQARALREAFIRHFIDTSTEHYQKHIATLIPCSGGDFYDGYLWECLKDNRNWRKECTMEAAAAFLRDKPDVFVMWDLFPQERIGSFALSSLGHPKDTVIRMPGRLLGQTVLEEWNGARAAWDAGFQYEGAWFPEDIYCFGADMSWFVIFTHEGHDQWTDPELDEDAYIRVCFRS